MTTYSCVTCGEVLPTKKDFNSHIKKCSNKATIHLPHVNQVITLERNEKGDFICHCSDSGCPRPFKFANNLRAHIKRAGSRWIGDDTKGNSPMEKLDLSYEEEGKAGGPSRVRKHLHDKISQCDSSDEGKAGGPSRASKHSHDDISEGDSSDEGKAGGPSKHLHDDISESNSRDVSTMHIAIGDKRMMVVMVHQFHQGCIGSPIVEDLGRIPSPDWMIPQDEIMHSPPPPAGDVRMVSPTAHKSAPPQKSPQAPAPPLSSLMSAIQAHNQNAGSVVPSSAQRTQQPQLPLTTAPGLISDGFLDSLNLAVNAEFHFLTCQVCEMALRAGEVKSHLAKIHGRQATYSDMTLKLSMASLEVKEQLPTGITGPRTIVHGLKVFEAMACSHCDFLSRSTEHLRKHHSKEHPMEPRPRHWRACKVQHLKESSGVLQTFWEVKDDEERQSQPTAQQALVDSLLKELEPTLEVVQTPLDGRMVAGKNVKLLRSWVALPKDNDGDIPGLKLAVQAYYRKALSLLDHTHELVLKRLNSPDPTKNGISNTPFHKHLHEATMKQYIIPVVALLAMLIRQQHAGGSFSGSNPNIMELLAVLRMGDEEGPEALQIIHQLLFEVWSTAWKPQGEGEIVDPTERCLALLTLGEDGGFKEPHLVTGIIAKLEYCMRLTFLQEIHHRTQSDPQSEDLDHCLALGSFFVENTQYTFSRLRSLQHRASSLSYDTMSLPQVWWTDTKTWKTMLYRGEQVDFADLCKVFEETEAKLVEAWEQGVLMGEDIRVDYDKIAEDLVNKDVGYSFLSDVRNPELGNRGQLVRHFLEDEETFAHFAMVRQGGIVWNVGALQAWLKKYAELQSLLLLRAQMLSGAPSRGTELTAMTYRNTQTRPTRNLVVLGKHVSLLCQYLKTTALTGKDKLIPHALDAITSDILVQDLALARPFAEIAAKACFPDRPEVVDLYRNHVFVNYDRLFDSKDLSLIMSRHSLPIMHFGLTINSWRHIQTAWKRKLGCAVEDVIEMDREDNVEALQAGHSRSTENRVYGISVEALAGAAEDVLPAYLNASMEWQRHCQVPVSGQWASYKTARAHPPSSPPPPAAPPAPEPRENKQPVAYSMPAEAVQKAMVDAVVAKLPSTDEIATKVMDKLMPALKGMLQDMFQSTTGGPSERTDKGKGKEREREKEQGQSTSHARAQSGISDRSPIWDHSDVELEQTDVHVQSAEPRTSGQSATLDQALQTMQGLLKNPSASWKSKEQHACMATVLKGETDLVAVLGTGAGKSMLAIIPSMVQPKEATVLVLPLNSLMLDYQRRLEEFRVPYQVYGTDKPLSSSTNLILVTADKALTPQWRSALAMLNQSKKVARLIFDEAHIPLMSKDYRMAFQSIHQLRSIPMQLVLLSATLPSWCMEEVKTTFQLVQQTEVIRQSTDRPELGYHLERVPVHSMARRVAEVLEEEGSLWEERDRALVFVTSIAAGQHLSHMTAYPFYNGDKGTSDKDRRWMYQQWIKGFSKVLIATTAFSAGNDYPHVRTVIHMDRPFDMVDYIQGQGRAGRDGQAANCYTIIPPTSTLPNIQTMGLEGEARWAIYELLYCYGPRRCLRFGMTLFNDSKGVGCWMEDGKEKCSVCLEEPGHNPLDIQVAGTARLKQQAMKSMEGRLMERPGTLKTSFDSAVVQARQRRGKEEMKQLEEGDRILAALESFEGCCSLCRVLREGAMERHGIRECPHLDGDGWSEYVEWRRGLQYDMRHHRKICYMCHVPQVNDKVHPQFKKAEKGNKDCKFADVVAPAAYGIYQNEELRREAEKKFGESWGEGGVYVKWLMGRPRQGHHSNLIDLMMWYHEHSQT
ncbi:hypothetical protein BKA82DRAFT_4365200 [Pisolithus tinctorius]|nr:hypothetical protein BKA82DRAFT_4365200 [Pisolithus tinctorius]